MKKRHLIIFAVVLFSSIILASNAEAFSTDSIFDGVADVIDRLLKIETVFVPLTESNLTSTRPNQTSVVENSLEPSSASLPDSGESTEYVIRGSFAGSNNIALLILLLIVTLLWVNKNKLKKH